MRVGCLNHVLHQAPDHPADGLPDAHIPALPGVERQRLPGDLPAHFLQVQLDLSLGSVAPGQHVIGVLQRLNPQLDAAGGQLMLIGEPNVQGVVEIVRAVGNHISHIDNLSLQ